MTLGIDTADLQALAVPRLAEVFAALGHDLQIVRPGAVDQSGPPDDLGNWPSSAETVTAVRGYLYQLDAMQRARLASQGAQTGIPDWQAILPISAPVEAPGFVIRWQGNTYYPKGDAVDEGNQGIAWAVGLSAPGER